MRRKGFGLPLFLALLASLFIAPSALSLYLVNQALGRVDFDIAKGNERAVAVIGSDMSTYYASVEGALRAATDKGGSQTVYVLPGISNDSNPIVIDEDCTVSSGVILSLPYAQSGTTFTTGFEGSEASQLYTTGQSDFGDSSPSNVGTNQKTLVVLGEGKKMTVEAGGSLVIGGQLGTTGGGQYAFGMTYGNYAELAMASGSSIDCLGNIDVRGYIKPWDEADNDTCLVTFGNEDGVSANLSLPLVFYDFPGGSVGLAGSASQTSVRSWNGSIVSGVFPFEMYDLPNVSVPFRAYYGSTIDCSYAFVMSDIAIGGSLSLLGNTNAIITLEEAGSYLELDYAPAAIYQAEDALPSGGSGEAEASKVDRGLTLNDPKILNGKGSWPSGTNSSGGKVEIEIDERGMARTTLAVSGKARTNEVSVMFNIMGMSLEVSTEGGTLWVLLLSKDYLPLAFPFSYKWNLEVLGGATVSVQSCLKFLPGSNLTIREGGALDIASDKEVAGIDTVKAGKNVSSYYPTEDKGQNAISSPTIVNNGSIVVRESGRLGASISSERAGATINFMGGATSSNTQVEGFEIGFKSGDGQYGGYFFDAEAYIGTSAESAALRSFAGLGSAFETIEGGEGGFYYAVAPAFLTVEDNGMTGFDVLVDGTPLDYEPGLAVELLPGTTVRVRYPRTNSAIGSISLNGSSLALQDDGTYLYAEFQASGSLTLSVNPVEWIAISSTNVSISYGGQTGDHDPHPFTVVWGLYDATGNQRHSGTASVSSGATSVSLGDAFPEEVQPGWQLALTISADNLGEDTVSVSSINGLSGSEYTFSRTDDTVRVSVSYNMAGGCIVEGTLVDMADGTTKKVEDLEIGDMVMAFDHEKGQEVASPILCVDVEEKADYLVSDLFFSDGTSIGIAFEHGFFDRTLNQYVYLTPENAEEFIGHEFYSLGGEELVLEGVETSLKEVALYSPVTAYTMNLFHEGLLGMPGGVEGFFNVFEYGEDMAYDPVKKAGDIAKYGLYTYEDVSGLISREAFDLLPIPYLKVAVGKGIIAWEDIVRMARMFADLLPQ